MKKITKIDQSSDNALTYHLKNWLRDFHGDVKELSDEFYKTRLKSYVKQEILFDEKLGFIFSIFGKKPKHALDIGSSAGGLSVAMALKDINVTGIEPSLSGVNVSKLRAKKYSLKNIKFIKAFGENIPLKDESVDFVISLAVLEHVNDVDKVIAEAYRVLKPGGSIYFEVPNNLFPFEAHYKMIWLPMMPKFLAKIYVKLRGCNATFLDTLHYMNIFSVLPRFKKAGFLNVKDVYPEYIFGKAKNENWTNKTGKLAKLGFLLPLLKFLYGMPPMSLFFNRAIFVIAYKKKN